MFNSNNQQKLFSKHFGFCVERLYETMYEWLSYKVPKESMQCLHCHFLKWIEMSISFFWTKEIRICAALSLSQCVIKAKFSFFQLSPFMNQMKFSTPMSPQTKWEPLKNNSYLKCRLNTTLSRSSISEKRKCVLESEWSSLSDKCAQIVCKMFLHDISES